MRNFLFYKFNIGSDICPIRGKDKESIMHALFLLSMLERFGLVLTLESFLWMIAIFKLWIGGKLLLALSILPIPP